MDNPKPIDVTYNEPSFGEPPGSTNLESIFGMMPQVTTTPTWTPRRYMDGFAFDTTTGKIYYYDFTNSAWKSVSGGAAGAMLTSSAGTFTMNFSDTKFVDLQGISASIGDLGNILTRAGTLKNLYIIVKSNTCNGTSTFVLYKNGSNTALTTTVASSSTSTGADTTHSVSASAGDKITMQVNTAGSSGAIAFGFSYQLD